VGNAVITLGRTHVVLDSAPRTKYR
jgi:hypothetical protein